MKTNVTELKIEDIKVGTGPEVKSGDTITIHYVGTLDDGAEGASRLSSPASEADRRGEKFDSSYDRNMPFETQIGVGRVIRGWDQGILGMKVGGKRRLTIPSELGYGEHGAGLVIPPFATLIFEVELLKIK